jgi:hypothetical protein
LRHHCGKLGDLASKGCQFRLDASKPRIIGLPGARRESSDFLAKLGEVRGEIWNRTGGRAFRKVPLSGIRVQTLDDCGEVVRRCRQFGNGRGRDRVRYANALARGVAFCLQVSPAPCLLVVEDGLAPDVGDPNDNEKQRYEKQIVGPAHVCPQNRSAQSLL